MTDILARLNSGAIHAEQRAKRPDCVDALGGIHRTPERAAYVNWRRKMNALYGSDARAWPPIPRAELQRRYVPA